MGRARKIVLKPRKDGRYQCQYKDHYFYGKTSDEALQAREEYKRREKQNMMPDNPTIRQYAAQWLPLHKSGVSNKCYNDYAKQIDALCDEIGDRRFSEVTVDDCKRVYTHYKGYSQSTIKRSRMLFISIFDTAIENGYATRNPFRSKFAQPDKGTEGTHRIISDEERQLIHTTPHRFQLGALAMLYAGLRRGEALAIDIDNDIDQSKEIIHVTKEVRFEGNKPIIDSPKTDAGVRDVPLLPELAQALKGKHGLLMSSAKGTLCTEQAQGRGWESYNKALSEKAGHEISIRCHDLRHTYCTMLRDAGVDMKLAMQWMGHADEKMILRVYDHVTESRIQDGIEKVKKSLLHCQNACQSENETCETVENTSVTGI